MLFFFVTLLTPALGHLFTWGREHGIYTHPCVEYRNAGMFATCDIEPNAELVRVPQNMTLVKDEHTHDILTDEIINFPNDHVLYPFVESLPADCQLPMCKPINHSEVTNYGARNLRSTLKRFGNWSDAQKITWSVIQSRTWNFGMLPIADLFNHDSGRGMVLKLGKEVHTITNGPYRVLTGHELFIDYGFSSMWYGYVHYGFIYSRAEPTCEDLRSLRLQTHATARTECIANATWTFADAIKELNDAVEHDDLTMIKGIGRWIDDYIKIQTKAYVL
tara:strand:+ start:1385 stop:2212 length:828 start_codon:yes stop_codon:yes gene_type:complete